jgi:hypothetical protein
MPEQPELFEARPTLEQPDQGDEGPPEWMVEILLPAARKIINQAQGTMDYHPDDRKRWARNLAMKLAELTLDEVAMIAMINEQDDDREH